MNNSTKEGVGLNDQAWKRLFDKYDILRHIDQEGAFSISAQQIKEFREPRLMTKFDHTVNLPRLFLDNGLSVLPVTRGSYLISRFSAYHDFELSSPPIQRCSLPPHIQSLDSSRITSEAIALNCAAAAGVVADFMEEDGGSGHVFPTVSGRMGSGSFSFRIRDTKIGRAHQISVQNSQIEIDAAYEGIGSLALVEAKMDISKDFLIRQLYYPFRVWEGRVTKPVKPIFMVYSNGIYRLYEYRFVEKEDYNSLKLIRQRFYSVEDTSLTVSDIQTVLDRAVPVEEPEIPFPQADKFERIINLCELVSQREMSRTEVTQNYDFDARQTNYYTDAARYLGLLDRVKRDGETFYQISEEGRRVLQLGFKPRQLEYCRRILSHRAFCLSLRLYFQRGTLPTADAVVNIMKRSGLYHVESEETFYRRSSTIRGWLNWIVSLINA